MPVDSGLYAAFAPKVRSIDEVQNALMQRDANALQMQSGQMNLLQQQRNFADDNTYRTTASSFGDDPTANYNALMRAGLASKAQEYQKSVLDTRKTQSDIDLATAHAGDFRSKGQETDLTNNSKKLELATRRLGAADPNDDEALVGAYQKNVEEGLYGPDRQKAIDTAVDMINKMPPKGTPERLKWYSNQLSMGVNYKDQLDQQMKAQEEAGRNTRQASQNQTHLAGIGMTQAGEDRRQSTRLAAENTVGGTEGFSPEAIENAAARYNLDGTLPPMGMGKAGSQGRQAILNKAAELKAGTSGTDQRVSQLDAKSAAAALTQLTKAQTNNAAFEKTANANAELALGLSNKMDRTGIPLLNAGIQAYRSGTGSPEATQFAAANQTFVAEYAKIMSGGMGNGPVSDAARGKAEKLLTTSMSPEQYAGNVKLLQTEMANRMKGFEQQGEELRTRMRGAPASGAASSPKVVHFGDLK